MARRPSRRDLSTGILVVLLAGVMVSQALQAGAAHQPADKVNASGETVEELGTGEATVPGEPILAPDPVELLSTTFKSSSPSDLMIHTTLECAIITTVVTPGSEDSGTNRGETEGRIRAWLTFDSADPALNVIPINTVSTNPQPHDPTEQGTDIDKVTFCNRAHVQELTDAEQDEDNDGDEGNDQLRTYLRTKSANAFNWMYLNTGNGMHTVRLWAEFIPGTNAGPGSESSGFVGNRMLIVEPTKMSNHAAV